MIDRKQLEILVSDLESDRVERTTSIRDTDKFSEAICAFANDLPNHKQPGYLIIEPPDRRVTDELLLNLAALRSDGNILPLPVISVGKFSLQQGEVAVVEVQPSDLPPVRYKGRVWVRVGPRKAIASEHDERILSERRTVHIQSFDSSPIRDAKLADLSLPLFHAYRETLVAPEIIAANHRSIEEQLASLRCYDLRSDCPTVAGILLFGRHPRFFFPGNYVQYLKFPGEAMVDRPDDQAEVYGDLLSILRELTIRIKTQIHTGLEPVSISREKFVFDYPEVALREVLFNAIMHRDYRSNTPVRFYCFSDHIEIQNPGGLYGAVTLDTLTSSNSYRNPILAEGMKAFGYVNRYGYGIQRAEDAMKENGSPPIKFEADQHVFQAVLYKKA